MLVASRLGLVLAIAAIVTPAAAQRDSESGPLDRCESTTCFNQLRIRNVEVVGERSMIVYVGGQQCPFLVEFTGTFCDLTFYSSFNVVFRPNRNTSARTPAVIGGTRGIDGGVGVEQTRICANDIDMGLIADPFNSAITDVAGNQDGLACRISDIRSLTDDERLEVYVDNQMSAPPPPFGTGRVEAPENPTEPADTSDVAEEDEERRRRRGDE